MSLWNASQIFRLKRKPLDLKCISNITNIRKRKTQSNLLVQLGSSWCGQQDLNLHELVLTRTWILRVCQFRHVRILLLILTRYSHRGRVSQSMLRNSAESTNTHTSPPLHYFVILAYSACNVNLLLHLCVNSHFNSLITSFFENFARRSGGQKNCLLSMRKPEIEIKHRKK